MDQTRIAHDSAPMPGTMSSDPFCLLMPKRPELGTLTAMARTSKLPEIESYERNKAVRTWRVRGIISDHVPLTGSPSVLGDRLSFGLAYLETSPQSIYLHSGGRHAIYYDLIAGPDKRLIHVEVGVQCKLPSVALTLAVQPLNALLDVLAGRFNQPLCLQRLELISPHDQSVLIQLLLLPAKDGISIGPLGGFLQAVPFAPYDAIYREALVSSSPFYRLLCAARMHEGTNSIRKWLKEQCAVRRITDKLPSEHPVDPQDLQGFGFTQEFVASIRTAQDLFHKLRYMRDAIAHFLITHDGRDMHVYLADGQALQHYSICAAAMLHYAHLTLEELRLFYTSKIGAITRGSILPTVENKDQFVVRASDFGLE